MAIFDFSKAFDSVPHRRLLAKLDFYGIRNSNLQWISSFLSARKQRVTLNGTQSSWHLLYLAYRKALSWDLYFFSSTSTILLPTTPPKFAYLQMTALSIAQ